MAIGKLGKRCWCETYLVAVCVAGLLPRVGRSIGILDLVSERVIAMVLIGCVNSNDSLGRQPVAWYLRLVCGTNSIVRHFSRSRTPPPTDTRAQEEHTWRQRRWVQTMRDQCLRWHTLTALTQSMSLSVTDDQRCATAHHLCLDFLYELNCRFSAHIRYKTRDYVRRN